MLREYVPITILTCLVKYQPFYTKHMPFSENKSILLQTPGGAGAGGGGRSIYFKVFSLSKCWKISYAPQMSTGLSVHKHGTAKLSPPPTRLLSLSQILSLQITGKTSSW